MSNWLSVVVAVSMWGCGSQWPSEGPQGPAGPAGLAGAPGAAGPAGAAGERGVPGPAVVLNVADGGSLVVDGGMVVIAGPRGDSVTLRVELPGANCAAGGAALTQGALTTYVCNGPQGVQGAQGVQGNAGAQGLQGVAGLQGIPGAGGLQGLPGSAGAQGPPGIPGVVTADRLPPAGSVMAFAGTVAPAGWVICDGAAVSRQAYADLFAAIGTTHGVGDGTTTFNTPDYRGRFLRGTDSGSTRDPDRAARSSMNTGANAGDLVGSVQDDAYRSHAHSYNTYWGYVASGSFGFPSGSINYNQGTGPLSTAAAGGSETRPLNASVTWIIKL